MELRLITLVIVQKLFSSFLLLFGDFTEHCRLLQGKKTDVAYFPRFGRVTKNKKRDNNMVFHFVDF